MRVIELTFDDPSENIKYDEELLIFAERNDNGKAIRFWESKSYFVSLGIITDRDDVHEDVCAKDGVPVIKRNSGGGAVLLGPGCLNYSVVFSLNKKLFDIRKSYNLILTEFCVALKALGYEAVEIKGTSDITLEDKKISGNAQIRRKKYLLHHGTLLYNFDLDLVSKYLKEPREQPKYRGLRKHKDFLRNIDLEPETFKHKLVQQFTTL